MNGLRMLTLVKNLSDVFPIHADLDGLKTVALFCGVGLTASLFAVSFGVDLGGLLY
jgi:hypothetical protein